MNDRQTTRSTRLLLSLLVCASLSSAACAPRVAAVRNPDEASDRGTSTGVLTVPPAARLPARAREITFLFTAPAGKRTAHAFRMLRERLESAGYRLTLDERAPHGASIELHVAQIGDAGSIEMSLEREGRVCESIVEPLPASEPALEASMEQLVSRLTASPSVSALAGDGAMTRTDG